MDIGDLYAGLNALDAVRLQRNPDGSQAGLLVDADPAIILWQVRRNPAAAADTYAANARLLEFDIHYRKNKLGTAVELPI